MGFFAKNVVRLSIGNAIAQVITIALVPIITRIYTPEDYGLFAIYLSITMILHPLSTLDFHRAMMLTNKKNDAANLLGLSYLLTLFFSIIIAVSSVFINLFAFLPKSWIANGFSAYLWFVPLGVLVQGYTLSSNFWALKSKMFGSMAIARITEAVTDRSFVLGMGFFSHLGAFGLIAGRILGPFFALCYLLHRSIIHEIKYMWRYLSFKKMIQLSRRYREFHLFSTLSMLVARLANEMPLLLLAFFFSSTVTGWYSLAMRVISMPMMFIGDAISKAFLQSATEDSAKGSNLSRNTVKLFSSLIYISLPPVLILFFFGDSLFNFVFGSEWGEAGTFAQILSLSFLFTFMYHPLSVLFDAYEKQKQRLMFILSLLLLRGAAVVWIASMGGSAHLALFAMAVATIIVYAGSFIFLFDLVGVSARNIFTIFMSKIAILAPFIIGLFFMKLFIAEYHLIVTMVLVILLLLQGIVLSLFEPLLNEGKIRFWAGL
jgi:O-antigen/teichoic acid export membrane protein